MPTWFLLYRGLNQLHRLPKRLLLPQWVSLPLIDLGDYFNLILGRYDFKLGIKFHDWENLN